MSIKFLVLGGGILGFWGGGSADFIFMGVRIFLIQVCRLIFFGDDVLWHPSRDNPCSRCWCNPLANANQHPAEDEGLVSELSTPLENCFLEKFFCTHVSP